MLFGKAVWKLCFRYMPHNRLPLLEILFETNFFSQIDLLLTWAGPVVRPVPRPRRLPRRSNRRRPPPPSLPTCREPPCTPGRAGRRKRGHGCWAVGVGGRENFFIESSSQQRTERKIAANEIAISLTFFGREKVHFLLFD